MKESFNLRKVRDIGDTISDTFTFIRLNGGSLFKLLLYIVAPLALLSSLAMAAWQYQFTQSFDLENIIINPEDPFEIYRAMFQPSFFIAMFLQMITSSILTASLIGYLRLYDEKDGVVNDIKEVGSFAIKNLLWVFFFSLVWTVMLSFGFLLLFIPGIFFGIATSLLFYVHFIEKKGFGESLSRSMDLVSGNWWETFGVWILLFCVYSLLGLVIQIPNTILTGATTALGGTTSTLAIVLQAIGTFLNYFLYTLLLIGGGLWYFSLVEKKEATSLERKIGEIGDGWDESMFR